MFHRIQLKEATEDLYRHSKFVVYRNGRVIGLKPPDGDPVQVDVLPGSTYLGSNGGRFCLYSQDRKKIYWVDEDDVYEVDWRLSTVPAEIFFSEESFNGVAAVDSQNRFVVISASGATVLSGSRPRLSPDRSLVIYPPLAVRASDLSLIPYAAKSGVDLDRAVREKFSRLWPDLDLSQIKGPFLDLNRELFFWALPSRSKKRRHAVGAFLFYPDFLTSGLSEDRIVLAVYDLPEPGVRLSSVWPLEGAFFAQWETADGQSFSAVVDTDSVRKVYSPDEEQEEPTLFPLDGLLRVKAFPYKPLAVSDEGIVISASAISDSRFAQSMKYQRVERPISEEITEYEWLLTRDSRICAYLGRKKKVEVSLRQKLNLVQPASALFFDLEALSSSRYYTAVEIKQSAWLGKKDVLEKDEKIFVRGRNEKEFTEFRLPKKLKWKQKKLKPKRIGI